MSTNGQGTLDSLTVAELTVGMIVPGELGPSLVLSIEERKWRFSDNPSRRIMFRLVGTEHVYSRMLDPEWVLATPDNAAFRRWLERVDS